MRDNNRKGTLADHHDYVVKRLVHDGVSKHALAREMGLPYSTVTDYTSRHRIAIADPITWDENWLEKHYGTMTIAEMARQIGVNRTTLHHKLVRMGLHRPTSKTEVWVFRSDVLSARWS